MTQLYWKKERGKLHRGSMYCDQITDPYFLLPVLRRMRVYEMIVPEVWI